MFKAIVRGITTCALFTIIPVLPAFTAVTMSLALVFAAVTAISALIAIPTALTIDACSQDRQSVQVTL